MMLPKPKRDVIVEDQAEYDPEDEEVFNELMQRA